MQTSVNFDGPTETMPGYVINPTGGLCHYVHASGPAALDLLPRGMAAPTPAGFFTTVDAAFGACRSGRADRVICLPGHAENIGAADAWASLGTKTGVKVIGIGEGAEKPTFTWTVAGSTLLMDAAGFGIKNCNLYLAGAHAAGSALTVAAPITISAASCRLFDCDIWWGFDADQIVAIGITTTAAADDLKLRRVKAYAETAAVPTTTFLRLTGTDYLDIEDCDILGPGSTTTVGPVQQLTTASLKARIVKSRFSNTLANSTIAFTAMAGCTGMVDLCGFGVLAAGNGLTTGSGLQVTNSKTAVAGAAGADTTG
jgi:hypothetical protein